MKSYDSVNEWVKAEYSTSSLKTKNYDTDSLTYAGQLVRKVYPRSPADLLGIKTGDILHAINGGIFDADDLEKTLKPRLLGRSHSFSFYRPTTRQAFIVKGLQFPFGIDLTNSLSSYQAMLRNGDPDPADCCDFWEADNNDALAELWHSFEALVIRYRDLNGSPFDGPLPESVSPNTTLPPADFLWPGHLVWLALCAACAGQTERASYVLAQVDAHFERSGDGAMVSALAAMEYARSLIAEAQFNQTMAITYIERAIDLAPDIEQLYRRHSNLTNTTISRPPSPYLGLKLNYNLPRHDPIGEFPQSPGQVELQEQVSKLLPGQFIVVTLMSLYRRNTPYVTGFNWSLIPLSRLNAFSEVQIITAWNPEESHDLSLPTVEAKLKKAGVSVCVLYDRNDTLAQKLSLSSAPTNLVLDHRGMVVAEGWLEKNVLWEALLT